MLTVRRRVIATSFYRPWNEIGIADNDLVHAVFSISVRVARSTASTTTRRRPHVVDRACGLQDIVEKFQGRRAFRRLRISCPNGAPKRSDWAI